MKKRVSKAKGKRETPKLPPLPDHVLPVRAIAIVQGLTALEREHRDSGESDPRLNAAAALFNAMLYERAQSLEAVVFDAWLCLNCDSVCADAKIYCRELCSQEASLVRYVRRKLVSGQLIDLDVLRDGIGSDLLMLGAGGYPERARTVSASMRRLIVERDGGQCRSCGARGTDVDHIDGDAPTLENLQLLCGPCNGKKMTENVETVYADEDAELFAFIRAQRRRLALRIVSPSPLRICDDEAAWPTQWPATKRQCFESRKTARRREIPQICEISDCAEAVTSRLCFSCRKFLCARHVTRVRTGPPGHGESNDYCPEDARDAHEVGAYDSRLRIDSEGDWYLSA